MKAIGSQIFETKRLRLRPFILDDAQAMYDNWASDPEVTPFLTWPAHDSVEVTKQILEEWVEAYDNPLTFKWGITLDGILIGDIGVVRMDEAINACEIGYGLSRQYWGQGIMTEALRAVSNYLLDEADFNRVAARHDTNNPASGKVMQKAGMHYEGILRQFDRNNQGLVDVAYYSLLKSDKQ